MYGLLPYNSSTRLGVECKLKPHTDFHLTFKLLSSLIQFIFLLECALLSEPNIGGADRLALVTLRQTHVRAGAGQVSLSLIIISFHSLHISIHTQHLPTQVGR